MQDNCEYLLLIPASKQLMILHGVMIVELLLVREGDHAGIS